MRLTADVSDQLYSVAASWFSGEQDEVEPALREIGALYADHAALLRAIVEVSTYDEEVARFWRALVGRFVEASRARVGDEATAFALVWMTERSFHQLTVQDEPIPREELVEALAGIWRRSVAG